MKRFPVFFTAKAGCDTLLWQILVFSWPQADWHAEELRAALSPVYILYPCSSVSAQQTVPRDPQHLLHKLKKLHAEAEKEYGLNLFTAFLGEGGKTIETIVNSKDAAIAKVRQRFKRARC